MSSKVSAIISAYFCELFLEGRIENLLEQSLKPKIVVVAKDGSPELEIARKYSRDGFEDFVIITTEGVPTVYEAWNEALKFCDTEYVTNANSDDRLYPGALSLLAKTLDKNPDHAVSYFNIDFVKTINGEPVNTSNWLEGGLDELMTGCFLGPMPMWRRSLHEKYGLFDGSL